MLSQTRLSDGRLIYLDPWMMHELTDLAVQAKRLIESCPRHKPDDQGRCEDPSCFWKNRANVLNWIDAHRGNDSAVQAGEDLYDACLRYSRDWQPPQKELGRVDKMMLRMDEVLDRVPDWLGRRGGQRKTR